MSATLKKVSGAIAATRTLLLTATAGVQTIVIGGTVSNVDTTGVYHSATVEILQADGTTYISLVTQAPVALGGSLVFPKFVMASGEKLYITADVANMVVAHVSYVEKT
jgi:hypothetical protein